MDHVLSGLISKRADIKSELDFLKSKIVEMENILSCLDVSINVFNPKFDLNSIKDKRYMKKSHLFKHNEAFKLILDVLRKADKPITMFQITAEVMKLKGLNFLDEALLSNIQSTLYTTVNKQKKDNIIFSIKENGEAEKFKIA